MLDYPKHYYISSGVGHSESELVAFDQALIDAGIANYNLLKISSILPIGATYEDTISLKEGSALLTAYAKISSNNTGELISSAVAVGIPTNKNKVGVIMEYSGKCSASESEKTVRNMVAEAMGNHNIECERIESSSIEATIESPNEYTSLISAISLW